MAIIVDKVQKKKDIALSCKDLFVQKGINNLTISEVAKTAGVGKGTIYEYFKNKEDIVFEITNLLILEHNEKKQREIDKVTSIKEKIKIFYSIFYSEEDAQLRVLYKEFLSISLMNKSTEMASFHTNCSSTQLAWFEQILQSGIDKGELVPAARDIAKGLFVIGEGMFISHEITDSRKNIKEEFDTFFDALFQLIEVKK